jgi:ADP-heptose:LPS heptosyltransferase
MKFNLIIKAFLLRCLTQKKPNDFEIDKTEKVLLFRYDRIGDMIITTPVIRELKLNKPEVSITVLASKVNREVLMNNPYVDNVVVNHKNQFFFNIISLLKLRRQKFDVCIEFDHSVVPHAIIRLIVINPKKIISVRKDGRYGVDANELSLYDIYTDRPKQEHYRNILLNTLKPFNIKPKSNNYDLFISGYDLKRAEDFISHYKTKTIIGINLEGAIKGKKIGFKELTKICNGLLDQDKNVQIVILTSPYNYTKVCKKLSQMSLDSVVISYRTDTILEVAAIVSRLNLIITPDTSIAHVASAFDKPVVTIHENNMDSYHLFAPISNLNRTVFSESKNGIIGFSIELLLNYCFELNNMNNKNYDKLILKG